MAATLPLTIYSPVVFPEHRSCALCDLHKGVKHVGLGARHLSRSKPPGPMQVPLLVVGQNPGQTEDEQGAPFLGVSGFYLHSVYIGMDHEKHGSIGPRFDRLCSVYVTNAARCGTWGGTEPTEKQYNICAPYLLKDIEEIHKLHSGAPLYVLLCGTNAVKSFYKVVTGKAVGLSASLDRAGETLTLPSGPVIPFSTFHPAYLIRKQSIFQEIVDRLTILHDAITGITPPPSKPNFVLPRRPVV